MPSLHSVHGERTTAPATSRQAPALRDLAAYDRNQLDPGRSLGWRILWYYVSLVFFEQGWLPVSHIKVVILRWFGARLGKGVVIKPHVRIKFPWRLEIGDHCWVGQGVWIDNLAPVRLESNVCLSQDAYLCTGSHDHRQAEFALITRPIEIAEGAWIGARAMLLPGVTVGRDAVAAAGAIVTRDIEPSRLVAGNPAVPMENDMPKPRQPR